MSTASVCYTSSLCDGGGTAVAACAAALPHDEPEGNATFLRLM